MTPHPAAHLYIHVPFCRFRCDYCDFFSRIGVAPERQVAIIRRTVDHIRDIVGTVPGTRTRLKSVYVGGGTPSVLTGEAREALLSALADVTAAIRPPHDDRDTLECTVEVNPEDVEPALLAELEGAGVNRLSIGIQSLQSPLLARIGRHTTVEATHRGLSIVADRWGGSWSADLITAIPGQTPKEAKEDIRALMTFAPDHVSLYELGIEEGTRLYRRYRSGSLPVSDDEHRTALLRLSRDHLSDAGLRWYEISSFARPGCEGRHNIAYWEMRPWAAAGPGAVALLPSTRTDSSHGTACHLHLPRRFDEYDKPDYGIVTESLDRRALLGEYLMMGFRMRDGIRRDAIARVFDRTLDVLIPETIRRWDRYLTEPIAGRLALTDGGAMLLDRFLVDAFVELDRRDVGLDAYRWPETATNASGREGAVRDT